MICRCRFKGQTDKRQQFFDRNESRQIFVVVGANDRQTNDSQSSTVVPTPVLDHDRYELTDTVKQRTEDMSRGPPIDFFLISRLNTLITPN